MTIATTLDWFFRLVGVFGVIWLGAFYSGKLLSKYFADSMLEQKKSELQKEVERLKSELGAETERLKADLAKETETHKLRLKKQELLFNRQMDAAKEFMELRREVVPVQTRPMMDISEAAEIMAHKLGDIEQRLNKYISEYGHAWPERIVDSLRERSFDVGEQKNFVTTGPDYSAPSTAIDAALDLIRALPKIEKEMRAMIVEV
jgi:hypothetical protein